jgi:hypothetical protein
MSIPEFEKDDRYIAVENDINYLALFFNQCFSNTIQVGCLKLAKKLERI